MDDELFFLLDKYDVKNPSKLELFIYKYLFYFKNNNSIEKIILLHNKNTNINLNEDVLKKLKNPPIFREFDDINIEAFFHVTHDNIISKNDNRILLDLLNGFKYKILNDKYCEYSLTFIIVKV